MRGAKKRRITQEDTARRSHNIINPNAQRHTMTVASVHASKTTVHVAHSGKPKAQPPMPVKPSLLANDMSSTDLPTDEDSDDLCLTIEASNELGQTQASRILLYILLDV